MKRQQLRGPLALNIYQKKENFFAKNRFRLMSFAAFSVLAVFLLLMGIIFKSVMFPTVKVVVINQSGAPMEQLQIRVAENDPAELANLQAASDFSASFSSKTDSGVSLEFTAGSRRRVVTFGALTDDSNCRYEVNVNSDGTDTVRVRAISYEYIFFPYVVSDETYELSTLSDDGGAASGMPEKNGVMSAGTDKPNASPLATVNL